MVALLLVVVGYTGVLAMDYSGWYRAKLDWNVMDSSLSLASVFSGKWQWTDAMRTSVYLSLDEDGVHQLKLGGQWYDSPQRWRGRINFNGSGFDYATLNWHYLRDPWDLEWESELDAGGPLNWDIDISYTSATEEWEITADFIDALTFSSFTGVITIPLPHAWHAELTGMLDTTHDPVFSYKETVYGPVMGGKFTAKYVGFAPTEVEFDRTWETKSESHEIDVEWDNEDGLQCSYTYQYEEATDIGSELTFRATVGAPLVFTRAEWDVYGADWYLYSDFIEQSIGFTIDRNLSFDLYLEIDAEFQLADGTQEIEAYLAGDSFSLDIDCRFTGGTLDELTVTVKLYF